jgi:hypothetical protein
MGQCYHKASQEDIPLACTMMSNVEQHMVMATCNACKQYIQFLADPSKYQNPNCTSCSSTNVLRLNDSSNIFNCNFCKKQFQFENDDEIICKCGKKDWDYFIY